MDGFQNGSIISINPSTIRAPLTLLSHSIFNPPPPYWRSFDPQRKRRSKCRHTRPLQNLLKDQRCRQSYSHRKGSPRQKSRAFNWGRGGEGWGANKKWNGPFCTTLPMVWFGLINSFNVWTFHACRFLTCLVLIIVLIVVLFLVRIRTNIATRNSPAKSITMLERKKEIVFWRELLPPSLRPTMYGPIPKGAVTFG